MIYIILTVILIIASFCDIKDMEVPVTLSGIAAVIRIIEMYIHQVQPMPYIPIAIIIFLILLFFAIFGNMGGADCLIGCICGLYLGITAIYGMLIAYILALPYTIMLEIKKDRHDYPFIPYISAGMVMAMMIERSFVG